MIRIRSFVRYVSPRIPFLISFCERSISFLSLSAIPATTLQHGAPAGEREEITPSLARVSLIAGLGGARTYIHTPPMTSVCAAVEGVEEDRGSVVGGLCRRTDPQ